jgi:hypothetical protein
VTTDIENVTPGSVARTADYLSQATAVEQARAVAEVQAAIVVAQQCPRNVPMAVQAMRDSCAQMGLAERAFFRYSRGGGAVTGPTVHLARELARCWGNIQYGIKETRRDDTLGESEMHAFAWDVQTNARASTDFVVKHGRDTRDGVKKLTDMRDIYENNANMGARRLREQIFAILPAWFTEEAKSRCNDTIEKGVGDKPLSARIADAIKAFEGKGVTVEQLEQKLGRQAAKWTAHDVAQMLVTFTSINRGEITIDEEFPSQRVTAAEITKAKRPAEPSTTAPLDADAAEIMAELAAETDEPSLLELPTGGEQ